MGWSQRSLQAIFRRHAWEPEVAEWLWLLLLEQAEKGNLQAILTALAYTVGSPDEVAAAADAPEAGAETVPIEEVIQGVLASIREGAT